jgi:hypothetical protein
MNLKTSSPNPNPKGNQAFKEDKNESILTFCNEIDRYGKSSRALTSISLRRFLGFAARVLRRNATLIYKVMSKIFRTKL